MKELDDLYVELLHLGFIMIRQAFDAGDREWLKAELEMLHNIPSLVAEPNAERHIYYWVKRAAGVHGLGQSMCTRHRK